MPGPAPEASTRLRSHRCRAKVPAASAVPRGSAAAAAAASRSAGRHGCWPRTQPQPPARRGPIGGPRRRPVSGTARSGRRWRPSADLGHDRDRHRRPRRRRCRAAARRAFPTDDRRRPQVRPRAAREAARVRGGGSARRCRARAASRVKPCGPGTKSSTPPVRCTPGDPRDRDLQLEVRDRLAERPAFPVAPARRAAARDRGRAPRAPPAPPGRAPRPRAPRRRPRRQGRGTPGRSRRARWRAAGAAPAPPDLLDQDAAGPRVGRLRHVGARQDHDRDACLSRRGGVGTDGSAAAPRPARCRRPGWPSARSR